jgi:hypothetical protein
MSGANLAKKAMTSLAGCCGVTMAAASVALRHQTLRCQNGRKGRKGDTIGDLLADRKGNDLPCRACLHGAGFKHLVQGLADKDKQSKFNGRGAPLFLLIDESINLTLALKVNSSKAP